MFVALFLRNGECHIVSYRSGFATYQTFCDKKVTKNARPNTLALDNTFRGMCQTCKSEYDSMYQDDLDYFPSLARNAGFSTYFSLPFYHRHNLRGPVAKYSDYEHWHRLNRYRRLADRKTKNRKPV